MIKLIYGPKGFGKTKIILDDVNAVATIAKGNVVFVTDKKICSVDININVRCIYTEEYGISSKDAFIGFIKGLMAGNSDIEYIFIDGLLRITDSSLAELEDFFTEIKALSDAMNLTVELTISSAKEDLPKFLSAYIG